MELLELSTDKHCLRSSEANYSSALYKHQFDINIFPNFNNDANNDDKDIYWAKLKTNTDTVTALGDNIFVDTAHNMPDPDTTTNVVERALQELEPSTTSAIVEQQWEWIHYLNYALQ